jgi:hypothetical protein
MRSMKVSLVLALSMALAVIGGCAVEPTELEEEEVALVESAPQSSTLAAQGEPSGFELSPLTEVIRWRCSSNGVHYATRPLCVSSCSGTCTARVFCYDNDGNPILCP